jgi:spermidine/putrescine transport system ATP-binding protein
VSQANAIDIREITKVFGQGAEAVRALDHVSLAIREGEFFTLLGPSGCGKTTLLRLLAGFEQPTAGAIKLYGDDLAGLPPFRRPVNTVFQNYALFPHMTVAGNVAFGLEMQRWKRDNIEKRVEEVLSLVKLAGYGQRKPVQLSGGQQQRVALARALANRPKVLLLDEPLSALDLKLRKEMQIELKRLQVETGITFVFVTHDQEEALTMSDRLAVMQDGQVLQVGTPAEIYERPTRRFVADFIGETNFLQGVLGRAGNGEIQVRLDIGGMVTTRHAEAHTDGERVTLAVRPERVDLEPVNGEAGEDAGNLKGVVETVVYFGTDTSYRVSIDHLPDPLLVRVQNRQGAASPFASGDSVRLRIPPEAVQVLAD